MTTTVFWKKIRMLPIIVTMVVVFVSSGILASHLAVANDSFPVAPWTNTHLKVQGVVDRIQGNVVFAKTPWGRWILGTTKTLKNLAVGDEVILYVNENNTLIDVHRKGAPGPHHRWLTGELVYATPEKKALKLWTESGMKTFPISTTALPKINSIPEGSKISVEVNEQGQVVDVDRFNLTIQVRTPYPSKDERYMTVTGLVTQVEPPLVFVDTPFGEMSVANVLNVNNIRPGDKMVLRLTKNYTVVDIRHAGKDNVEHRYLTGKLRYLDADSILMDTPEGVQEYKLSRKSQAALSQLQSGDYIMVELDEKGNVMSVQQSEGQA